MSKSFPRPGSAIRFSLPRIVENGDQETHAQHFTSTPAYNLPIAQAVRSEFTVRRVLLATDFSPECEPAVHCAAALAEHFAARLYVLHVISNDGDPADGDRLPPHAADEMRRLRGRLLARVDDYLLATLAGSPAPRIVEKARQLDADVIVLGAHHAARPPVGSDVMREVCETSPCPVVCVPCPIEKGANDENRRRAA